MWYLTIKNIFAIWWLFFTHLHYRCFKWYLKYDADQSNKSAGWVRIAALVYCFNIFGNSGGIWIGWFAYIVELNVGIAWSNESKCNPDLNQTYVRFWQSHYFKLTDTCKNVTMLNFFYFMAKYFYVTSNSENLYFVKNSLFCRKKYCCFTGCVRDRDLHARKYWTPNFLGFFDFVKTNKLLITQKKNLDTSTKSQLPRAWCPKVR